MRREIIKKYKTRHWNKTCKG